MLANSANASVPIQKSHNSPEVSICVEHETSSAKQTDADTTSTYNVTKLPYELVAADDDIFRNPSNVNTSKKSAEIVNKISAPEPRDFENYNNVLVKELSELVESVPEQGGSKDHSVESRCIRKSKAADITQIGQGDTYDDDIYDADNCIKETQNHSNPKSVKRLDKECSESGNDTVIVVKRKLRSKRQILLNTSTEHVISPKLHKTKAGGEIHFITRWKTFKSVLGKSFIDPRHVFKSWQT